MEKMKIGKLFSKKMIGNQFIRDIKERGYIALTVPLNSDTLDTITENIFDPIIVDLRNDDVLSDEKVYLNHVKNVLNRLKNSYKKYKVKISINNRETLRESNLLSEIPANINLIIGTNEHDYNFNEYRKEEEKLEKLIAHIRNANLSPLEKFYAVYDVVKNYKVYKNNEDIPNDAVLLNRILSDNNEYIVCEGFARLLEELLTRVGIPCKRILVNIDMSYDGKFTQEEKPLNFELHARNLIKIDDDKYNIHGYYISDSTWDNSLKHNFYLNSLMTFDRKKEAKRLEKLENEDLLLDFHDIDELVTKIKYYITRSIRSANGNPTYEERLRCNAYKSIYLKIIDILKYTDREECRILYDKYDSLININLLGVTSKDLEKHVKNLLTDYAKYILPLVNKKIDTEVTIKALIAIRRKLYHENNEEIKAWLNPVIKENMIAARYSFPYIYDPNNKTEAFVESRKGKK